MSQPAPSRIMVVDDDPKMGELVRLILMQDGHQVVLANSGENAFNLATTQPPPHAFVVDVVLPGMDGFALCRKLREHPSTHNIPILIASSKEDVSAKVKGFEAGADDYLVKPFEPEELRYRVKNLLTRVHQTAEKKPGGRAPGKAIVFFGSKGGVGKTSIALNLAVALQKKAVAKKIALIDADFGFGDIAARLNFSTTRNVLDLARNADQLDAELVNQVMVSHTCGLRVLLNPIHPAEAEFITADHVKKIMGVITSLYDVTVVDCSSTYEERTLAVLDHADMLMLVVTPEIGPVKNASQFLELAKDLGIPSEKIHVVLNRADSNVGIEPAEIERTYKRKFSFSLPSAGRAITQSSNQGTPLVLAQPNHAWSQQVYRVAENLVKRLSQE